MGEYVVPFLGLVGLSALWTVALFPSNCAGIALIVCFIVFYTAACTL